MVIFFMSLVYSQEFTVPIIIDDHDSDGYTNLEEYPNSLLAYDGYGVLQFSSGFEDSVTINSENLIIYEKSKSRYYHWQFNSRS